MKLPIAERLSDTALKRKIPLFVRSSSATTDHKCGGCAMHVEFDGDRAHCTKVAGEISLAHGRCRLWSPGPEAGIEDIASRRLDKGTAVYGERSGAVNCASCDMSIPAIEGADEMCCLLWKQGVNPGDYCLAWAVPVDRLTEDRRTISRRWAHALDEGVGLAFTDRYDALGITPPDPAEVCQGQCEGTGWVPICEDDMEEPWRALWLQAEAELPTDDGWHFVICPTCEGTGKARPHEARVAHVALEGDDDPPRVRAAKRAVAEALRRQR